MAPHDAAPRLAVCIHGHFYQPPRENPWLEEIEREPSAAPHHDWNARISDECYTPNAWARVLDGDGKVARLYNNYERLSFNIGPTLVSWMERHARRTLDAIVRADEASVARLGHGNALAQVYNHAILPLATERDKRTQIRWGIRAFERTFGRKPEGMWLAETAVDDDSLDALAQEGIVFTVLSPFQARRFRVDLDAPLNDDAHDGGNDDGNRDGDGDIDIDGKGPSGPWLDCSHGQVPSGRAYRYRTRQGREIALFFYDGGLAKGIAFERLLRDASVVEYALRQRGQRREGARPGEPWLVHTATDGESYGHHFQFGDMALAATFARLDEDSDVDVTNYGTFLAQHGTAGDVELHAISSWSCAHGVGRWERDCGCRMQHEGGWNQQWRAPLRQGLNKLRDELDAFAAQQLGRLVKDPHAARDAYIDVVLDRRDAGAFVVVHQVRPLDAAEQRRLWVLLELQRCSLLMFTSCGWFFDDISGPEPVILMRYAARALSLMARVDIDVATRCQRGFETALHDAVSNIVDASGRRRTGRDIFRDEALRAEVGPDRVAIALALRSASPSAAALEAWSPGAFVVVDHEEHAVDDAPVTCVTGFVTLEDTRTSERSVRTFVVVGVGGVDWRGVIFGNDAGVTSTPEVLRSGATPTLDAGASNPGAPGATDEARAHRHHLEQRLRQARDVGDLLAILDDEVGHGARPFTLKDAPGDLRSALVTLALQRRVAITDDVVAELLLSERALLRGVVGMGVPLQPSLRTLLAHALSRQAARIVDELRDPRVDVAPLARRLRTLVDDAKGLEVALRLDELEAPLALLVEKELQAFVDRGNEGGHPNVAIVARIERLLSLLGAVVAGTHDPATPTPTTTTTTAAPRLVLGLLRAGADLKGLARRRTIFVDAASVLLPQVDAVCQSRLASTSQSA